MERNMERNKEFDKYLVEILASISTMLQFDYSLPESDCFTNSIHSRVLRMQSLIEREKLKKESPTTARKENA